MSPEHLERISERYDTLIEELPEGPWGKAACRRLLILLRFLIRGELEKHNQVSEQLCSLERQKKLLERQGIVVVFLDGEIERLRSLAKLYRKLLANYGGDLTGLLDLWQLAGATRAELLELCGVCRLESWKEQDMAGRDPKEPFSSLLTAYNLDYPNNGDSFLRDEVDAPFTHAAKEYMVELMLNTEAGRKASREALEECFPELWDKGMYEATDEEGRKILVDKDGELAGYLEEGR